MMPSRRKSTVAWAAVIITAATIFMAVVNVRLFESFPLSGDEYAYVYQARTFLAGRLVNPPAPDPEAFRQVHVVTTFESMYSKYPPGWPAVLALGEAVEAGALVNPLLMAMVLAVTFVFARRMASDRVSLVLLILLASGPFVLLNGAGFYSHPWVTLLWLLALWSFRSYHRRPHWGPALALGALYGIIFLARPQDILFLVPATMVLIALVVRRAGPRSAMAHLGLAAIPAAGCIGLFLAYNAGTTGDPWLMGHLVAQPQDHPILNLKSMVQATGSRVLAYVEVSGIALATLLWWGPGGRRPYRPLLLLLVLAGAYMLAYGFYPFPDAPPHFGPRYWFLMHIPLMLPAAWALTRALRPRRLAAVVALVALLQLVQTGFMVYSARLTYRAATGPMRTARLLAENLAPERVAIALAGSAGSVPFYDLVRNDLDYGNPAWMIRVDRDHDEEYRFTQDGRTPTDGSLYTRFDASGGPPLLGDRRLYLWEGAGGLPLLRALDAGAPVQMIYAADPPVILGGDPVVGWTTTTSGNRCGKRYYEHPGARPGDWTRFGVCGEVRFAGDAPPAPGEVWPETKRRWFARQYRTSLLVEAPDTYIFSVLADDEARLWVDGREVLRADCEKLDRPVEVRVRLEPGLHPLTLSYANIDIPARLTWSVTRASDGREVAPNRYRTWPLP